MKRTASCMMIVLALVFLVIKCVNAEMFSFSHNDSIISEGVSYAPPPARVSYYKQSPVLFFGIRFLDNYADNSFHIRFSDDSWMGAIWMDGGISISAYPNAVLVDQRLDPHEATWITGVFDFSQMYDIGYPICYSPQPDPNEPNYQRPHWDLQSFEVALLAEGGLAIDWMGFASSPNDFPVPEPISLLLLSIALVCVVEKKYNC